FNITSTPTADVTVSMSGPSTAVAGNQITYTITVTNPGPSAAQSVQLTDDVPAGTTFVSATQTSPPGGVTPVGSPVTQASTDVPKTVTDSTTTTSAINFNSVPPG